MIFFAWWLELALVILAGLVWYLVQSVPHPRGPTENEKLHYHPVTDKYINAPSVNDNASVYMTIVVPAYNETERIGTMLSDTVNYLKSVPEKTFEILVVDDGSKDETTKVVSDWARANDVENLYVLKLDINRGKGGAVTQGVLSSRGRFVLFVDADGASKISDLKLLEEAASKKSVDDRVMAIGSRHHLVDSEAVVKRSFLRNFLMHAFHTIIYILGVRGIKDTQCGFKMFSRKAARLIFSNMHVEGWIFDIEVLLLAQWFGIPIAEQPIGWHEVAGSKMSLLKDSLRMLRDLVIIRACYQLGYWRLVGMHKSDAQQRKSSDAKKLE